MNQTFKIEADDVIAAQLFVNGLNIQVTNKPTDHAESRDDLTVTITPSLNQVVDWDLVGNPLQQTYEYTFEGNLDISKRILSDEQYQNNIASVLAEYLLGDIKDEIVRRIQQKLYDIYIESPEERLMKAMKAMKEA